ncbi:hypothetical protein AAMO2058_000340400 [Amorphochlora amoebiformis]|uniref:Biogenesis of lysosome-related organelles complex 1 subunit 3 n=1 Tax=Amorphochlora amoebiformis TaxID=1561963 RepID=A0A7S0H4E5_9EUKA|mmetsp:Transcript_28714/g.45859  ORF Transcript_28714/g.45859 Transcript_28714/m.45859 type:complete len:180 (+) Transcript_28714:32-571(+)
MATVLGEDDESSEGEIEPTTITQKPHIITGEDSEEEDDAPVAQEVETSNLVNPHLALHRKNLSAQQGSGAGESSKVTDVKVKETTTRPGFKGTDVESVELTPMVKALLERNRRFLIRGPTLVTAKLDALHNTLNKTSKVVQDTLNTLQELPVYIKLGINDARRICDVIDESEQHVPQMN